jgi:hypothetical protein
VISFGIATDLETSEAKTIFAKESISADEVIDAHQLISESKNGFQGFISSSIRRPCFFVVREPSSSS